ncbi:MAG: hypothetical protein NT116_00020, partial [Candidatus Parcubacteria bacterium]|nr:hypothetical protein [Candidatus Parcubacteria bacterium]
FVIDLSPIISFISHFVDQVAYDFGTAATAYEVAWILLFKYWGWLIVIWVFLVDLAYPEYMWFIQNRWYARNITTTLLAIDVPKMNEQSVQAMENFFDHLQGAHGTITLWDKYIKGEFQLSFSCEIVSIEGNVQFIVRTPTHWRNLVEAAIYSQFTDAEITEVADYTGAVPRWYPNDTHDIWGCEFTLSNKNVYLPIKTYTKFEHRFSEVFVDPMAAMLENMSQIGPGEQMWLQILIKPLPVDWGREGGEKVINKILKIPPAASKKGIMGSVVELGSGLASEFSSQIAGVTSGEGSSEKKEDQPFRMMNLTPGQKEQLELIERKIAKLAFDTKVRYIYVAEKDKMNKSLGVNGMVGVIKQWSDMNANSLKPDLKPTGTNAPQYLLINYRRNSRRNWLLGGYISRDTVRGDPAKPMCSEELASLWHFPSMFVKAPLLRKTEFRKAAAPVDLPFSAATQAPKPKQVSEVIAEKTTVLPSFDYDNDTFEMQFAKDKEAFKKSRPAREERLKEVAKEDAVKLEKFKKSEMEATK